MRERLAGAALRLFREAGPEGVSLRKLSQELGISHTMLYRYFDNKDALFTAVRVASLQVLHGALLEADVAAAPVLTRIRAAVQALVSFGLQYPREYRFLFADEQPELSGNHALLQLRHQVFDHIVMIATVAQRQQVIALEPRTWVHMAWALLHGILTLRESNQLLEGRQFDELLEPALTLLLPGT
jgi:AcrR family transcriptional regulator